MKNMTPDEMQNLVGCGWIRDTWEDIKEWAEETFGGDDDDDCNDTWTGILRGPISGGTHPIGCPAPNPTPAPQ